MTREESYRRWLVTWGSVREVHRRGWCKGKTIKRVEPRKISTLFRTGNCKFKGLFAIIYYHVSLWNSDNGIKLFPIRPESKKGCENATDKISDYVMVKKINAWSGSGEVKSVMAGVMGQLRLRLIPLKYHMKSSQRPRDTANPNISLILDRLWSDQVTL